MELFIMIDAARALQPNYLQSFLSGYARQDRRSTCLSYYFETSGQFVGIRAQIAFLRSIYISNKFRLLRHPRRPSLLDLVSVS